MGPDESCAYEPTGDEPMIAPRRAATYGATTSEPTLEWSPEAAARMQAIPSFVRAVVAQRVEQFARARGRTRVDLEALAEVRKAMPVDFSKKTPFFMKASEGREA